MSISWDEFNDILAPVQDLGLQAGSGFLKFFGVLGGGATDLFSGDFLNLIAFAGIALVGIYVVAK